MYLLYLLNLALVFCWEINVSFVKECVCLCLLTVVAVMQEFIALRLPAY